MIVMKRLLLVSFLSVFGSVMPVAAYAACTGPSGVAGETIYNTDYALLQFCDGTNWVGMAGGGAAPSGSLTDGDKGDVQVSGSGATWTIDSAAVSYAKIQDVSATSRLLGRASAGAGIVEEITIGSGLTLTGTTLSAAGGANALGAAGYLQFSNGSGGLDYSGTTAKQQLFWDNTNKRLGVGTVTPTVPLDINGDYAEARTVSGLTTGYANFSARNDLNKAMDMTVYGSASASTLFGISAASSAVLYSNADWMMMGTGSAAPLIFGTSGAERMRIRATGEVGIGTTPATTAILDVSSTTKGFLPPRMTTTQVGAITSPAEGLMVYDTITHQLKVRTDSAWVALGAGGGGGSSDGTAGYVQLSGGSGAFTSSGTTAGQQFFWDNTNKRLGIGTATPVQPLDVVGTATMNTVRIKTTAGAAAPVGGSGLWTTDGTHVWRAAGNVGIGTSSPGSPLSISSTMNSLVSLVSSSTSATYMYLSNTSASGRNWYVGSTGSANGQGVGKFVIWDDTASANRFTIDSAGSVGIATTTPKTLVDVRGNIGLTGGLMFNMYYDGAWKSTSTGYGSYWAFDKTSGMTYLYNTAASANTDAAQTPVARVYMPSNGYVGVGVSPTVKLQVANNVATGYLDTYPEYQLGLFDGGTALTTYGLGVKSSTMVLNSGGGAFSFDRAGAATTMVLDASGNVGIATVSPKAGFKLDVVGDVNMGPGGNTYATTPAGTGALTLNGSSLLRMVMNDGTGNFNMYLNSYYDGTNYKYQQAAAASRFTMSGNTFAMQVAPTGVAGNTVTWTPGLSIDGNAAVTLGTLAAPLNLGANAVTSTAGTVIDGAGGWHRTYGSTGWVNGTYSGGMYMADTSYVRTYNNKSLAVDSTVASSPAIFAAAAGSATYGIQATSASTFGVMGQSTLAGSGGVIGYSQNGAAYGMLGHANAYALYGAGALYVTGAISTASTIAATGTISSSGNMTINNTAPTLVLQDTDGLSGFLHQNGGDMYVLSGNANNGAYGAWTMHGSAWPLKINMTTDDVTVGGNLTVPEGNLSVTGTLATTGAATIGNAAGGGQITVGVQNTAGEGGQIDLAGSNGAAGHSIDTVSGTFRIFNNSTNNTYAHIFNAGTGTMGLYVEGKLGIGISNPSQSLEINGDMSLNNGGYIFGSDSSTANQLNLLASNSTNTGGSVSVYGVTSANPGQVYLRGATDTNNTSATLIFQKRASNGTAANLGVWRSNGDLAVYGSVGSCVIGTSASSVSCTSDERLKKDIIPLTNALDSLVKLQGVTYHWKDKAKEKTENIGMIAQVVEKVYPQLVVTDPDTGIKSLDYAGLVAPLVEGVKELKALFDNLKADMDEKYAALKAENAAQKAEIDALKAQNAEILNRLNALEGAQ